MEQVLPRDDFELEFSTDELSLHNPAQYFGGVAEVLDAMQVLDANLVAFILPSARASQHVEQISFGSIRLKIASAIAYLPDEVLATGDYKRAIGFFLVEGRKAILRWLRANPKAIEAAQVEAIGVEIDGLAAKTGSPVSGRRFSRRLLLSMVVRLIRATQSVPGRETVTAIFANERIVLPRETAVSTGVAQSVAEVELEPFEQEMRLLVKKPDMIGNSQWEFLDRGHVIRAKMADLTWVEGYHKNEFALKPGDGIEARVRLTPRHGTSDSSYNYEVFRVRGVIPSTVIQQSPLFDDT